MVCECDADVHAAALELAVQFCAEADGVDQEGS